VLLQDGSRADTEEGDIVGEFTDQELIYFPRDPRADHLYGFSPVEQTIVTINTGIRRGLTNARVENNVPEGPLRCGKAYARHRFRFQCHGRHSPTLTTQ
jgi:hypothetical protein